MPLNDIYKHIENLCIWVRFSLKKCVSMKNIFSSSVYLTYFCSTSVILALSSQSIKNLMDLDENQKTLAVTWNRKMYKEKIPKE